MIVYLSLIRASVCLPHAQAKEVIYFSAFALYAASLFVCPLGGYGRLKAGGFRELNLKVQFGHIFLPALVEWKGILRTVVQCIVETIVIWTLYCPSSRELLT